MRSRDGRQDLLLQPSLRGVRSVVSRPFPLFSRSPSVVSPRVVSGAPRVASRPARLVSRSPSAASLFAAGYWRKTNFLKEMAAEGKDKAGEIDFYDSVSGAKLFTAPRGRTSS